MKGAFTGRDKSGAEKRAIFSDFTLDIARILCYIKGQDFSALTWEAQPQKGVYN